MNAATKLRTIDELTRAVDAARASATDATLEDLMATVRAADALSAAAVAMLRLHGRAAGWDAKALTGTADALAHMPSTADALAEGVISFSQARAIAREVRDLDAAGKNRVDAMVATRAPALADAEPEALLVQVEDEVARLRPDLLGRREERAIGSSFLALQPHLGGGGSLYGQADTERFATICEAVDVPAARPVAPEHEDAPTRGAQRMDALVGICENALAGGTSPGRTRPRPRFLVSCELSDLAALGASEASRVLTRAAGRPPRLSPVATGILDCDPEVVAVLFDGATPIAISDATTPLPGKIRTALIARDGGCRFPGCAAPAAWTDAHHIIGRGDPRSTHDPANLVLLCRRCHDRVHRRRWRISPRPDGVIEFAHRGRVCTSVSRSRPPPRE